MIKKLMPYGNYFSIGLWNIHIMINGYMFSVYKGLNSGKYTISCWSNYWRKTKTPVENCKLNNVPPK